VKLRRWCRSRTAARLGGTAAVSLVLAGSLVLTSTDVAHATTGLDDVAVIVAGRSVIAPLSTLVGTGILATAGLALVGAGAIWLGGNCISGEGVCPIPEATIANWKQNLGNLWEGLQSGVRQVASPGSYSTLHVTGDTWAEYAGVGKYKVDMSWSASGSNPSYYPTGMSRAALCVSGPASTEWAYPPGTIYGGWDGTPVLQLSTSQAGGSYVPCSGLAAGPDWVAVGFKISGAITGSFTQDTYVAWNPYASAALGEAATNLAVRTTTQCVSLTDPTDTNEVTNTSTIGSLVPSLALCAEGYMPVSTDYALVGGNPSVANAPASWASLGSAGSVGTIGWAPGVREEYPNCVSGDCAMWVTVDGVELQQGNPDAPYWWRISQLTPERVSCRWGGAWGSYVMPLADCDPLKYAWATPTTTGTVFDPERGYVPVTGPEFAPWPTETPLPEVETLPEPEPTGSPSATPSTSGDPSGSPSASPPVIPESGTNPDPDPSDNAMECIGNTWTWNPISWVYAPVKCALLWAFVPQSGALDNVKDDIEISWNDTPIPTWVDVPLGLIPSGASSGGCAGPAMALGEPFNATLYPLSACEAPMSGIAAVCKTGISAILVFAGVRSSLSLLLSGIGFAWPSHEIGGK